MEQPEVPPAILKPPNTKALEALREVYELIRDYERLTPGFADFFDFGFEFDLGVELDSFLPSDLAAWVREQQQSKRQNP